MTKYCYFPNIHSGLRFGIVEELESQSKSYYQNTFIFKVTSNNRLTIDGIFEMRNKHFFKTASIRTIMNLKKAFDAAWKNTQSNHNPYNHYYEFSMNVDEIKGYKSICKKYLDSTQLHTTISRKNQAFPTALSRQFDHKQTDITEKNNQPKSKCQQKSNSNKKRLFPDNILSTHHSNATCSHKSAIAHNIQSNARKRQRNNQHNTSIAIRKKAKSA